MQFVKIQLPRPKEEVMQMICDNERVNKNVIFDENDGVPLMKFKENGESLKITCEMQNRPTKDDGFLVGTFFSGKVKERDGVTTVSGIILTAPIYHLFMIALMAFFVYRCITLGGINFVPIFLLIFSLFMFRGEFKKQGYIKRYLYRAAKRLMQEEKQK